MRWVVPMMMLSLLAGCAGAPTGPMEPEAFEDVEATSTTGIIRGIVVDDAVMPVPGASVVIATTGTETTSDADGAFVFSDLEPGTYFLTVTAYGHNEVQTSAIVEAGVEKPPIVRVSLQRVEIPDPYVEVLQHHFFMDGSTWVGGVGGVVATFGLIGEGSYQANLDFSDNTTWAQGELVWEAAQPAAETMRLTTILRNADGDPMVSRNEVGTSPIVAPWGADNDVTDAVQNRVVLFVNNGELPVGVTLSQDLEYFLHVFHHFVPPEGWTFGEDGAPVVPPA